jgi:hypothetical protein
VEFNEQKLKTRGFYQRESTLVKSNLVNTLFAIFYFCPLIRAGSAPAVTTAVASLVSPEGVRLQLPTEPNSEILINLGRLKSNESNSATYHQLVRLFDPDRPPDKQIISREHSQIVIPIQVWCRFQRNRNEHKCLVEVHNSKNE